MSSSRLLRSYFQIFALTLASACIGTNVWAQDAEMTPETTTTDPTTAPSAVSAEAPTTTPEVDMSWSLSCEMGASLVAGNSRSGSIASGCNSMKRFDRLKLIGKGSVSWGRARYGGRGVDANGNPIPRGDWIISERRAEATLREEYSVSNDRRNYVFSSQSVAHDEFAGYKLRIDLEAGAGRIYVLNEIQEHAIELGIQYEHEQGIFEDDNRVGMVATMFGSTKLKENGLFEYSVSWLPSFLDSEDWRIKGSSGLSFKLTDRLSYKSNVSILYNNQPSFVTPLDQFGSKVPGVGTVPARKTDTTWNNVLVVSIL